MSDTAPTPRAVRADPRTGGQEVAEFLSVDGTALFGFTHLPAEPTRSGVVIFSPLHAEFVRNYRREVVLARRLASLGFAVQRFHYRGHGNSGGRDEDTSYATMVRDALVATERLREVARVDRVTLFGTRFGALIAATVASRDASPVVLWDPIVEATEYLYDVFRAHRVQALRGGDGASTRPDELLERLMRTGSLPVLGYTLTRLLYVSSRGRCLEVELGDTPRRAFLLRMGKDRRTDEPMAGLLDRWRAKGLAVDEVRLARREPWWFTSGESTAKEALERASDVTVDWIQRALRLETSA